MSTVLITGANRGIGLELVKAYLSDGANVIACCRNPENASELSKTGAEIHQLQVADPSSVSALKAVLGDRPIDILINNAGIGDRSGLENLDFDRFEEVLQVNSLGPMRIIDAFKDNVAASGTRMIANLSSQLGSIENADADWGLIYRTSKAALNMALRSAAPALASRGITTLALHPGWVATDMGGKEAPVSPTESAAGLKRVIADAGHADTLRFLDWEGTKLPW